MTQPRVGIAITADDKTAKGFASAEKRAGRTVGAIGDANRRWARDAQSSVSRSGSGIIGTLSRVEQAGAKLFGGRSITSGISTRLSAIGEAGGAARVGMAGAAEAGGALEVAAAGVGVAVGATVGILAAAGYAAFKLADGWAKGAASIGRTAETIGVSTKALQEFTGAAERMGMDKGAAAGSLGGLSQTLNDARYGRNSAALAVLGRLGVKLQTRADGSVDIAAMLPAIADAMARQNAPGRMLVANTLGIGAAGIPLFSQGGKKFAADMADIDTHGAMIDDAGIDTGKRIARKSVMVGQLGERAMMSGGAAVASASEAGFDAVLSGGQALANGSKSFGGIVKQTFAPAAEKIAQGGRAIERAAVGLTAATISMFQRVAGQHGQRASLMLAQYGQESSFGRNMPKGSNNPFGIKAKSGEPFVWARTREEDKSGHSYYTMARFRKFGSLEEAAEARAKFLDGRRYAGVKRAHSAEEAADAVAAAGYATDHNYAPALKRQIRSHHLEQYDRPVAEPVAVQIHVTDARVKATARRGRGPAPAISIAHLH